ncbi:hypothetical protein [Sinorhizobium psoraleae]|uniref:Uncharacterized protein n=1 Tax=Sinorhizobium psoraleae TaxID=520838 RepID=A0ABT4KA99_9HYPH|nr:hypothetical protein [Sinorhizobium psoraleae]MCZ4088883.1 hypothetical protein [Sinorhizobium psoraleae]
MVRHFASLGLERLVRKRHAPHGVADSARAAPNTKMKTKVSPFHEPRRRLAEHHCEIRNKIEIIMQLLLWVFGGKISQCWPSGREEIGAPPYPSWTAVGVNWLAGFDFEIKVIARIP